MYQPLDALFKNRQTISLTSDDIRHLIQTFLREQLRCDTVYCEKVNKDKIFIRVASPTIQQAVLLLEYDIQQMLNRETGYSVSKLRVRCD